VNIVEIRNLSFAYPFTEKVLDKINLNIASGEFVTITGPTGSGKSTLLYTLNGLIPHEIPGAFSGIVTVNGKDVSKHAVCELARDVQLVFQDPESQLFNFDVISELEFGLENFNISDHSIIEKVSRELKIDHMLERETHKLSGGEKQRVVIASALVLAPQILCLDEPFSELDYSSRKDLLKILEKLKARGTTIICIEHRPEYLEGLTDRIIELKKGKIID
jgi:energy-coupling factor transport system ATP-binding protein